MMEELAQVVAKATGWAARGAGWVADVLGGTELPEPRRSRERRRARAAKDAARTRSAS
ncbi:hypothetical protein ACIQRS_03705 [Streptomyces termitum]|nr:hypothetical protein [Streptomyces termitum]